MKAEKLIRSLLIFLAIIGLLILFPVWLLFVRVINLIGLKEIRSANGKVETPVVFYEHPATKRVVAFVATVHIGEPEYFAGLQRLLESLTGYSILFEGVGRLSPEEEQSLTEEERHIANDFDRGFKWVADVCDVMSLQHQKDGLAYSPSWVNTDIRLCDLVRLFAQSGVHFLPMEKDLKLFQDEAGRIVTRWFINKVFGWFAPVAVLAFVLGFFSKRERKSAKLILNARNEIAFRGITGNLPKGNVATIWGSEHLGGIAKYLKQAGFREVRCEWFTAYHVRNYSLLGCLREIQSVAAASASATATLRKD